MTINWSNATMAIKRNRTKFAAPDNTGLVMMLDSARGVYIPRDCMDILKESVWQPVSLSDSITLSDPTNELYWEVWERMLDTQYATDTQGRRWELLHDGDLWAVCYEALTTDEKESLDLER